MCTFIGEIGRGNCLLNGDVLTPSHLLFSMLLNSTIMKIYVKGQSLGDCIFIEEVPHEKYRKAKFKCKCGNEFIAAICNVKFRYTKSCGCIKRGRKDQGCHSRSPEYDIWKHAKKRCYVETNPQYKNYGGRGIKMHDGWINNSKAFVEYIKSLPNYHISGLSLDRIDNDYGYYPGNLRWADASTQRLNQRKYRLVRVYD